MTVHGSMLRHIRQKRKSSQERVTYNLDDDEIILWSVPGPNRLTTDSYSD